MAVIQKQTQMAQALKHGPFSQQAAQTFLTTRSTDLPTLLAALEAACLVDALSDTNASLTVFPPTEEAFAALPDGVLGALLADPDALANVLTYHVIGSEVVVSAALDLAPSTVEKLNGVDVALTTRDDNYLYVNLSKVVGFDSEASNRCHSFCRLRVTASGSHTFHHACCENCIVEQRL